MDRHVERLAQAGLYGAGLYTVETPVLVGRYNDCLKQLGIDPTTLARFRIDGVGWSPEVAAEKGDEAYLSHGVANRYTVILTPDQRNRPIYVPSNSFDRRMMEQFFSQFEAQISDITATNALVLSIDHGFSDFTNLQDLLWIDHVVVRPSAAQGQLMEAACSQRQLVERFMSEGDAWFDSSLRQGIIASAKQYGDLRERKLEIPEMRFSDLRSFHTEAFKGVFVIRTEEGKDDLLIVENKDLLGTPSKRTANVFGINDTKLIDRLFDGIIDVDFGWYTEHLDELDRKIELLAADVLCSADSELDYCGLTLPQKRKLLTANRKSLPASYPELERVRKMLERGKQPDISDLDRETVLTLIHPRQELPEWYREVIWELICRIAPYDPLRLYVADKNRFFSTYETWPESKRAWAVNLIAAVYRARMNRKVE